MTNQKQLDILKQGVPAWNIWREFNPDTRIDLTEADLSGADLSGANLSGADLSGADLSRARLAFNYGPTDLSGANLSGTNLSYAYIQDANLSGTNLSGANLREANLSLTNLSGADLIHADLSFVNFMAAKLGGANLSGANLSGANLGEAKLGGTNLEGAKTGWTHFAGLDLGHTKGLENVQHGGPSYISTSTLSRSQGNIPDAFLKGAGLDDTFIEYNRSLTTKPIEYYTCFISHSSKDELFARRLHNDLRQEGVSCWFAPEDMDIGDKIRHRIDESIRLYDKLLLILSEHSIESTWVEYEVERALNKEPQGIPNVLYPVRVDQAVMTCNAEWARQIKSTRHIGDFEHWTNPQQYEATFKRLLRALNAKKEQGKS